MYLFQGGKIFTIAPAIPGSLRKTFKTSVLGIPISLVFRSSVSGDQTASVSPVKKKGIELISLFIG